jgi:hypothetical protein
MANSGEPAVFGVAAFDAGEFDVVVEVPKAGPPPEWCPPRRSRGCCGDPPAQLPLTARGCRAGPRSGRLMMVELGVVRGAFGTCRADVHGGGVQARYLVEEFVLRVSGDRVRVDHGQVIVYRQRRFGV